MTGLSPIDVEKYENQFKTLSENLEKASNFLIPDAYQTEKEQLLSAKALVDKHFYGFNEVLNFCSAGVLFNESFMPLVSVENNINQTVSGILWSCQDIISSIIILNEDFSEYLLNMGMSDPMIYKLDQFVLVEDNFNFIVDDLEECSKLIMSVQTKLDGYYI